MSFSAHRRLHCSVGCEELGHHGLCRYPLENGWRLIDESFGIASPSSTQTQDGDGGESEDGSSVDGRSGEIPPPGHRGDASIENVLEEVAGRRQAEGLVTASELATSSRIVVGQDGRIFDAMSDDSSICARRSSSLGPSIA